MLKDTNDHVFNKLFVFENVTIISYVTKLVWICRVASGVVLGGNARFHSKAKSVVDIIIDTANEASQTIYNTTGAMKDIRDNLGASGSDAETASFLTSTSRELDSEAADIHRQAKNNRHKIDKGLKIV